jgi:hypothetical protein
VAVTVEQKRRKNLNAKELKLFVKRSEQEMKDLKLEEPQEKRLLTKNY